MAVMSVTDVMTTAVVLLEVVVVTLSRGATVVWSFRESLMILEGRRVLADLATAAGGLEMWDNSIDVPNMLILR